jgi:hypothetical protein
MAAHQAASRAEPPQPTRLPILEIHRGQKGVGNLQTRSKKALEGSVSLRDWELFSGRSKGTDHCIVPSLNHKSAGAAQLRRSFRIGLIFTRAAILLRKRSVNRKKTPM